MQGPKQLPAFFFFFFFLGGGGGGGGGGEGGLHNHNYSFLGHQNPISTIKAPSSDLLLLSVVVHTCLQVSM